MVVAAIKRDTGRPFGAGTTCKKWADLQSGKQEVVRRRGAVRRRSKSGGDEGGDGDGSSPDACGEEEPVEVEVSEEDLPSYKYSFEGAEHDRLVQGGGRGVAFGY